MAALVVGASSMARFVCFEEPVGYPERTFTSITTLKVHVRQKASLGVTLGYRLILAIYWTAWLLVHPFGKACAHVSLSSAMDSHSYPCNTLLTDYRDARVERAVGSVLHGGSSRLECNSHVPLPVGRGPGRGALSVEAHRHPGVHTTRYHR